MTYYNKKFKNSKYAFINKEIFPAVYSRTGELYAIHPDLITYVQTREQYDLDDLRSTDTVIDLGANIGAFSFLAAKRGCKRIFAYEPVIYGALWKNVKLNQLEDRIFTSWYGVGDGKDQRVEWMGEKRTIETRTMTDILKTTNGCDFLKCDTEGAEWYIKPEELESVRHIEMEFHMFHPLASKYKIEKYNRYFDMKFRDRKGETLWYSGTNKYV